MTSPFDRQFNKPNYPAFSEKGYPYVPQVPPDMWPSGLGPGASHYNSTFGRHLAGADKMSSFDGQNAEGIETYPNELDALAAADDTAGNGVFDPNLTHGNIHPDAGVFNDHQSLPGYVARDKFYEMSEVSDLTQNGGKVMYVPGGAVSLQQGQQYTLTQNSEFWQLPMELNPMDPVDVDQMSTVDAPTATWPVSGYGYGGMGAEETTPVKKDYKPYYIAAGVGLAAGIAYLMLRKKGKRR